VTQHDRHVQRLLIDLIAQRDKIFKELRRQSVRKNRPESLDESHRRERYEARSRAVSAAAKSPRIQPVDLTNGAEKIASPQAKRVSGISGILGHRSTSHPPEPADQLSLDAEPPAEESNDVNSPVDNSVPPIEVTKTEDTLPSAGEFPTKKPSLGRTYRVNRPVGLQRHIKRESVPTGEPNSDVQDKDAAAVAANVQRESGRGFGVTLTDGPVGE
jgi:hypothetical protein